MLVTDLRHLPLKANVCLCCYLSVLTRLSVRLQIHTSLINGRPSAADPSPTLLNFTSARYIRLVFQRIRTLNADLMTLTLHDPRDSDPIVTRRVRLNVNYASYLFFSKFKTSDRIIEGPGENELRHNLKIPVKSQKVLHAKVMF